MVVLKLLSWLSCNIHHWDCAALQSAVSSMNGVRLASRSNDVYPWNPTKTHGYSRRFPSIITGRCYCRGRSLTNYDHWGTTECRSTISKTLGTMRLQLNILQEEAGSRSTVNRDLPHMIDPLVKGSLATDSCLTVAYYPAVVEASLVSPQCSFVPVPAPPLFAC